MNSAALVPIDPALLALIHGSFLAGGGLQPFAQEIMLIECHIAGTSYRDVKPAQSLMEPGSCLVLQREPQNAFDPLAIKILTTAGHHVGYVPKVKNEALARLMDAGKLLFGKVDTKHWENEWLSVTLRVFLRD